MKKFLIFVCSSLIFAILAFQGMEYISYKKVLNSVPNAENSPLFAEKDGIVTISISAVGDCFFGTDVNLVGAGSFDEVLKNQGYDYSYCFAKVQKYFEKDDFTVINYEGTISENGVRAEKEFAFRSNPDYVKFLTEGSVEVANLSNNHSRDYGEISLQDTKDILTENGIINFIGRKIAIVEKEGIKIGFIGTNTMRYDENSLFLDNMNLLKEQSPDIIIAVFHWGEERATVPNMSQQELAHTAIDNGADLVIGHHPHVLQGVEKYNGKYILYSLGNFCFGGNKNPPDKDSMIFNQVFFFKDGKLLDIENASIIPCSISSVPHINNYQPTPLSEDEFTRVKEKIIELSKGFDGVTDITFIEDK